MDALQRDPRQLTACFQRSPASRSALPQPYPLLAADAGKLGAVEPQAQIDREGETDHADDVTHWRNARNGKCLAARERQHKDKDSGNFAWLNRHI